MLLYFIRHSHYVGRYDAHQMSIIEEFVFIVVSQMSGHSCPLIGWVAKAINSCLSQGLMISYCYLQPVIDQYRGVKPDHFNPPWDYTEGQVKLHRSHEISRGYYENSTSVQLLPPSKPVFSSYIPLWMTQKAQRVNDLVCQTSFQQLSWGTQPVVAAIHKNLMVHGGLISCNHDVQIPTSKNEGGKKDEINSFYISVIAKVLHAYIPFFRSFKTILVWKPDLER